MNRESRTRDPPATDPRLEVFRQRHGRNPRILHIGNIANNAYMNAKLLNELGFDCDVLCADYYHIMACPEWEDADFEGDVGDPCVPDWRRVDLRGFSRPRWFAQGPRWAAVRYLLARRRGQEFAARFWWWMCSRWWRRVPHVDLMRSIWLRLMSLPRAVALLGVLAGLLLAVQASRGVGLGMVAASGLLAAWHTRTRLGRFLEERRDPYRFAARADELLRRFRARFPDRGDPLTLADLRLYERAVVKLRPLLAHYDLVQGYAVDPIYPLLGATRPFVGYEHGTLRDIPCEPTTRGRVTALAYADANAIYMTNADSVPQALQLQPDRRRVVFGIHGFDERRLQDWAATQNLGEFTGRRFGVDRGTTLFFAPARHDHAIKGNDRVIHALRLVADRCPDEFRVVFVRWGQEVDRSERLLAEVGVGDHVVWIDPLPKRGLWRAYCSADAVLDQFVLPCFGGVTIEALALGTCPVLTHVDADMMNEFYGASPPLFNCSSPEEIAGAMNTVIREPDRVREVAARSKRWLEESHSHRVVTRTHLDLYETAGLFAQSGDATQPAL